MAAKLTHPVPEGWPPEKWVAHLRAGADASEQKAARELPSTKKEVFQKVAKLLRADADAIAAGLKETQVPITDAAELLRRRYRGDSEREVSRQIERVNADVARLIYDLRQEAGLTQVELAKRAKTTQSVMSRLEDADYEGHSLTLLIRVAVAMGRKVVVRLEDGDGADGRC